jgi:hypothetical protein
MRALRKKRALEKFPMLAASRLYVMVHERGYRGSPHHFRHLIACLRPRPKAEAFLRLRTLPGEQAQVDWAHFGHLVIGRAPSRLSSKVAPTMIALVEKRRTFKVTT